MKKVIFLCVAVAIGSENSYAQTYYGDGYTFVTEQSSQADIKQPIYKELQANNLGQALTNLLSGTGWTLANNQNADPEIYRLYGQPLAQEKRILGPMPLDRALSYLSGNAWNLVVDPVNRIVSFEIKEPYRINRVSAKSAKHYDRPKSYQQQNVKVSQNVQYVNANKRIANNKQRAARKNIAGQGIFSNVKFVIGE